MEERGDEDNEEEDEETKSGSTCLLISLPVTVHPDGKKEAADAFNENFKPIVLPTLLLLAL